MPIPSKRFQQWLLFVATLSCLLPLLLPMFGLLRPGGEVLVDEKRRLAPFPSLVPAAWEAFPGAFESYFADRFAFRQVLTSIHHRLLLGWLHRSPSPQVVVGEGGWLFYQESGNAIDLYHRNIKPFSPGEVASIHDELTRRRLWVESWGGRAIFVLVPNKETIYSEWLPANYRLPANPISRFDQWTAIFKQDPALTQIDLRPVLLAAKGQGLLYFRGDSHWNADGAYLGYRELLTVLRRWFPDLSLVAREEKVEAKPYRGDLAQFLAVGDGWDELYRPDYRVPKGTPPWKYAKRAPPLSQGVPIPAKSEPLVYVRENSDLPRAVLVRDSMANFWLPWLPDNFRRLVVMYNWFPAAKMIALEKPDVVIFENVERSMEQYLKVHLQVESDRNEASFTWER